MDYSYMTDAQLASEIARCEFCEEKPCKDACPADCSPADFIMAAKNMTAADIGRAAGIIMSANPLGGTCGGACPDYHCMKACSRKGFDRPVEIPTVQASIVERAYNLGTMPTLARGDNNGKKVAVVGAGPAGLGAAAYLAQNGYQVELLEKGEKAGGACALIPPHRLPTHVVQADLDWLLRHSNIRLRTGQQLSAPETLLDDFDGVIVAEGLHSPIKLGIPGEEHARFGNEFLAAPGEVTGAVAIIGGGAVACDCAVVAKIAGATRVEMFALEALSELPMTAHERQLLLDWDIDVSCRTSVKAASWTGDSIALDTVKVSLPPGEAFNPAKINDVSGSQQGRQGFSQLIIAIGARSALPSVKDPLILRAGDCANGPTTVVEAVASGKNAAASLHATLAALPAPVIASPVKSQVMLPGFDRRPVPLDTDFFGRTLPSPFLLSAAPPSDGYDQMKKAYEAGWAGGVMKTAFDGLDIHIPAAYMHVFDGDTYGNCDNVSGHPLDRVCAEIEQLVKEYPDRLTAASTGGPVSGDDVADKLSWQNNMRMLEDAGAMAVEFSLSCPQGGDGTEGDIVSQSPGLTAKIIDWIMEAGRPDVPKLFKLTGAVTSIPVIMGAIKEVLDRYPDKAAGVTLANTFPSLDFRAGNRAEWDEGIVFGMSGSGVAPISNLTLANVAGMGVYVSGNGGAMDYRSGANFLALGAGTVQFCTVAMKYGVDIIEELHMGLSYLMKAREIKSVADLIGIAVPGHITDFMALTPTKGISSVVPELCQHCGNCTRCGYLAITLDNDGVPQIDPEKCVGCSLCAQKCFSGALSMRQRTEHELAVLKED